MQRLLHAVKLMQSAGARNDDAFGPMVGGVEVAEENGSWSGCRREELGASSAVHWKGVLLRERMGGGDPELMT